MQRLHFLPRVVVFNENANQPAAKQTNANYQTSKQASRQQSTYFLYVALLDFKHAVALARLSVAFYSCDVLRRAGSGSTVGFNGLSLRRGAFRKNTSSRWPDRSLENLVEMTVAVANSDLLRLTAVELGLV